MIRPLNILFLSGVLSWVAISASSTDEAKRTGADPHCDRALVSNDPWEGEFTPYKKHWKGFYHRDSWRETFTIRRQGDTYVCLVNGKPWYKPLQQKRDSLEPILEGGALRVIDRVSFGETPVLRILFCYEVVYLVKGSPPEDWLIAMDSNGQ